MYINNLKSIGRVVMKKISMIICAISLALMLSACGLCGGGCGGDTCGGGGGCGCNNTCTSY